MKIDSPVLNTEELESISKSPSISMETFSTLYPLKKALTVGGLVAQLDALCERVVAAVKGGANVINLSDRLRDYGADVLLSDLSYIPPLLAVVLQIMIISVVYFFHTIYLH